MLQLIDRQAAIARLRDFDAACSAFEHQIIAAGKDRHGAVGLLLSFDVDQLRQVASGRIALVAQADGIAGRSAAPFGVGDLQY